MGGGRYQAQTPYYPAPALIQPYNRSMTNKMNVCPFPTLLTITVDPLQNAQLSIGFQPLYEAIHIYSSLGKLEELRTTYDADRRRQMDLLLPATLNIDENGSELRNLLANITGFAVIERATSIKAQTFRSQSEVEALWDLMCVRVIHLVTDTVSKIVDSKLLLLVKDLIELFMHTVQVHRFRRILTRVEL